MKEKLKKRLAELSDIPGVYLMKDSGGKVIYVGKASSLKKRVGSYFRPGGLDVKTLLMTEKIEDFEVIPVASEAEALLLENRLIKKYQPRYNVDLKDGKSYPFVKITPGDFPSVLVVREPMDADSTYYGPFPDATLLKEIVRFLRRYYPVRNCAREMGRKNSRVCTQYDIGRCSGPCGGKITMLDYSKHVRGIKAFFSGEYAEFEKQLRRWMIEAAENLEYEKANEIKKRLLMLDRLRKRFPLRDEKELLSYGENNVLCKLAGILRLDRTPYAIEGFDVSNTSGTLATASKVLFRGGIPDRQGYRRYRIIFRSNIDDYRMIEEALERRFSSENDREMPDLVLVDGGRGHLGIAAGVLGRMKLDIPVVSLAKENEEIFVPWSREPLRLGEDSRERHLLQRIRDEAHRFALSYHRKIRARKVKESFLDGIKGIGEERKKKIVAAFPDVYSISEADIGILREAGLTEKAAAEVVRRAKQLGG